MKKAKLQFIDPVSYTHLNLKIENMHEQFLARQKQGKSLEKQASAEKAPSKSSEFVYAAVDPSRDYGFVAVAAGEGLKAVFTLSLIHISISL